MMFSYVGFGVAVFMLMVSLTVGSYWWSLAWLWLMWANASSIANSVQTREVIESLDESVKVAMYNAIIKARGIEG